MQIEKRIMAVWRLPPQSEGRKITLRMKLSPGGYTSEVRVETSSGDEKFDASASMRCDARRHFRRCRYCPRRERPRNPPSRRRKGFQVNKSKMLRLLSFPVLILLRAIHGSEGLDNLTTMGDGVSDEQEPIHTPGLRCSIVVCERAKARVGAIAEHRSEAEAGIYYEGEPLGCALSKLGEFVGSAESSIGCLDPVEYLDTENQESAGQASDQEVHE